MITILYLPFVYQYGGFFIQTIEAVAYGMQQDWTAQNKTKALTDVKVDPWLGRFSTPRAQRPYKDAFVRVVFLAEELGVQ